ncbi:hypothetical protein [Comamonas odontotermitis]
MRVFCPPTLQHSEASVLPDGCITWCSRLTCIQ